ncbi:hypothetical protein SAMN05216218_11382 [Halorientalis regularis]|jgi:hypothetical protein|uniref:Uncharacterized protein n=1 Tax=Halorientalis regularis TaxID=660518 RepID=A0A1G7QSY2_9EURY|nr:hypothetical protein SAMN05216218_11382 [Halorientalis regularis]
MDADTAGRRRSVVDSKASVTGFFADELAVG